MREQGRSGPGHPATGPAAASLALGPVATVSCCGLGQVMGSCPGPGAHTTEHNTPQVVETQEPGAEPEAEPTSTPAVEDEC